MYETWLNTLRSHWTPWTPNLQVYRVRRPQMAFTSTRMACPACGNRIKLTAISPRSDPIMKYPALRRCPSCGTLLRFNLPKWVIPSLVVIALILVVPIMVVLDSGMFDTIRDSEKLLGLAGGAILLPILLPLTFWLMANQMSITSATKTQKTNSRDLFVRLFSLNSVTIIRR